MKYAAYSLLREGLRGNANWTPAWSQAEPRAQYDAIIIGGIDAQAGPFRKQMTEMGMTIPRFGSSISSDAFVSLAGKTAEGAYSGDSCQALDKMPGGPDFTRTFNAKYGKVVMYAPYGYDATNVLINAMKYEGGPADARPEGHARQLLLAFRRPPAGLAPAGALYPHLARREGIRSGLRQRGARLDAHFP